MTDSASPLTESILRVQREIDNLRDTAHILTPMARTKIDGVALGKIPVLRVASLSPNPDDQEVYLVKKGYRDVPDKFALTKVGLQRLESLAGITGWTTKVEHFPKINDKGQTVPDPLHVKVQAYAEIEDIDGTVRGKPQTVELNLNDGTPQTEKMIKVREDGTKDFKELAQARVNIVRLAESKAMNAVRRDLLNLQATFTAKELKKPFVIMKLIDAPLDPNDPLVRKLMIMKQMRISSEMYDAAVASLPDPVEVMSLPQPVAPQALPPGPPVAPETDLERLALIEEVENLYARKVRGGRSATKVPLNMLDEAQLRGIQAVLLEKPDIA